MSEVIQAQFPKKLEFLFRPKRYKVVYGGRGGAKSWNFARALLIMGAQRQLRILCTREFQNSISESVHKLLSDQVYSLNLPYKIEKTSIHCPDTGTEFSFEGIHRNIQRVRSYEGIDICWVEEANSVVKSSWEVLIPTIRKANSEIWISFNPELETDETYQRFVVDPPEDAIVQLMNWRDNPWFPETLRREKDELYRKDMDAYLNVWEGQCRVVLDGAVYSIELRDCAKDGRITRVPLERSVAVDTFWDLGRADSTAIWFGQYVGFEYRIVDFYQGRLRGLDHYLEMLQSRAHSKGYQYGTLWLPHDAKAKTIGTKRSVEEQCKAKGYTVRIVPQLSLADGIEAARAVFPSCYFDEKACSEGLQCLRHYKYDLKEGVLSKTPLHDQYSHAADAFRYLGVAMRGPKKPGVGKIYDLGNKIADAVRTRVPSPLGWMG